MKVKIVKKANKTIDEKVIVKKAVMRPPTLRQAKAVVAVAKGGKSKAQILRDKGYSEAVARNPKRVFNSPVVKQEMDKVLQALEKERDAIIEEMIKKRSRAQYRDLGGVLDKLLGKIELLSGKPTDRIVSELPDEDKELLENLFKNHK